MSRLREWHLTLRSPTARDHTANLRGRVSWPVSGPGLASRLDSVLYRRSVESAVGSMSAMALAAPLVLGQVQRQLVGQLGGSVPAGGDASHLAGGAPVTGGIGHVTATRTVPCRRPATRLMMAAPTDALSETSGRHGIGIITAGGWQRHATVGTKPVGETDQRPQSHPYSLPESVPCLGDSAHLPRVHDQAVALGDGTLLLLDVVRADAATGVLQDGGAEPLRQRVHRGSG